MARTNNRPFGTEARPPRVRPATQVGGSGAKPPSRPCCLMVAAVRCVKQGRYRLARRYAAMSVRRMTARVT